MSTNSSITDLIQGFQDLKYHGPRIPTKLVEPPLDRDSLRTKQRNRPRIPTEPVAPPLDRDSLRMRQMNRRPGKPALSRDLVKARAVSGLASTVTSTWQNQFLLAPIALATAGRAGYFWATLVTFIIMYIVYLGFNEKGERWTASAGQYFWIAQMAPRAFRKALSFFSGWMLVLSWQLFVTAGVMIIGNGAAALVMLHTGTNYTWLPTVLSSATAFLIYSVNRWAFPLLAQLEFIFLMYQVAAFVILTLVLLLLKRGSGLRYATAYDVFLNFDNSSGWPTPASILLAVLVPLSSSVGYDCAFHMGKYTIIDD
ncbi:hypothetical protein LTS10_013302 [Elasticomyces elasticus]|nr:hypothetical protein LTS10_013302 [Elasticomyces elasticus]